MPDIIYAVHTRTCTYLLDEEGVCRWIVSPTGMLPADVRHAVGAQFVACLDLRVAGGLVGELRIGATALFVKASDEGKMVLLRTAAIEHVEFRDPAEPLPSAPRPPRDLAPPRASEQGWAAASSRSGGAAPPARRRRDTMTMPMAQAAARGAPGDPERDDELAVEELDTSDLVPYEGEDATVTLTMPLFRPDAQAGSARRRGVDPGRGGRRRG